MTSIISVSMVISLQIMGVDPDILAYRIFARQNSQYKCVHMEIRLQLAGIITVHTDCSLYLHEYQQLHPVMSV